DELHAHQDHHATQDDRAEDAPEEHAVLVEAGHPEGREDHRDHEEVVDRKTLLDQVAGEEVDALVPTEKEEDEAVEDQRKRDPEAGPEQRFLRPDDVGFAVEDPEVEREEDDDEEEKPRPEHGRFGAKHHDGRPGASEEDMSSGSE